MIGQLQLPRFTIEIHPDDENDPKNAFTYSTCPETRKMVRDDEDGLWVKVSPGRYEMIQKFAHESGKANTSSFDTVQRPAHYNQSDIECIDAIKASMTLAEFQSYLEGNVLKYLWRYRHKNGLEDVKKAQWYINRLAAELEESEKGAEQ